jgi:hypothetical protein
MFMILPKGLLVQPKKNVRWRAEEEARKEALGSSSA